MRLYDKLKKPKFLLKGVATYLPRHFRRYLPQHQPQFLGEGVRNERIDIKDAARACYTVWLRFLVRLGEQNDFSLSSIHAIGEIGPGDNIGIGFCGLLSGASSYVAFDVVPTGFNHANHEILEELICLFQDRAPIPDEKEFPRCFPRLTSYKFPAHILTEDVLRFSLQPERLKKIRQALGAISRGDGVEGEITISYTLPWLEKKPSEDSIDLILSNAALEHVDDLPGTYRASTQLVRKGGWGAHTIGLDCHGTSSLWNGHWTYGDLFWHILRGNSAYLINRTPVSGHVHLLEQEHFRVVEKDCYKRTNELSRDDLAAQFRGLGDEDLKTHSAFLLVMKE